MNIREALGDELYFDIINTVQIRRPKETNARLREIASTLLVETCILNWSRNFAIKPTDSVYATIKYHIETRYLPEVWMLVCGASVKTASCMRPVSIDNFDNATRPEVATTIAVLLETEARYLIDPENNLSAREMAKRDERFVHACEMLGLDGAPHYFSLANDVAEQQLAKARNLKLYEAKSYLSSLLLPWAVTYGNYMQDVLAPLKL